MLAEHERFHSAAEPIRHSAFIVIHLSQHALGSRACHVHPILYRGCPETRTNLVAKLSATQQLSRNTRCWPSTGVATPVLSSLPRRPESPQDRRSHRTGRTVGRGRERASWGTSGARGKPECLAGLAVVCCPDTLQDRRSRRPARFTRRPNIPPGSALDYRSAGTSEPSAQN